MKAAFECKQQKQVWQSKTPEELWQILPDAEQNVAANKTALNVP